MAKGGLRAGLLARTLFGFGPVSGPNIPCAISFSPDAKTSGSYLRLQGRRDTHKLVFLNTLSLQHETLGLLDVRGTRVCSERLRWSRTVPSSVERPAALSPARAAGGSAVVRRLVLDPGGRLGCARWPGIDVRVRAEEPTTVRAAHFT